MQPTEKFPSCASCIIDNVIWKKKKIESVNNFHVLVVCVNNCHVLLAGVILSLFIVKKFQGIQCFIFEIARACELKETKLSRKQNLPTTELLSVG